MKISGEAPAQTMHVTLLSVTDIGSTVPSYPHASLCLSVLAVPVELFTLFLYMPFMLLFSDIRQGIFYSVLLCFWILFAGEHLMVS